MPNTKLIAVLGSYTEEVKLTSIGSLELQVAGHTSEGYKQLIDIIISFTPHKGEYSFEILCRDKDNKYIKLIEMEDGEWNLKNIT